MLAEATEDSAPGSVYTSSNHPAFLALRVYMKQPFVATSGSALDQTTHIRVGSRTGFSAARAPQAATAAMVDPIAVLFIIVLLPSMGFTPP